MPGINYADPNSKEYQDAFGVGRNEIEDETVVQGNASVFSGERYLIVGLGGQGVRTVAKIKKLAQKRFAGINAQNSRVIFAALDTDNAMFSNSGLEQSEIFPIPIDTQALKATYNYSWTVGRGIPRDPFPASWVNNNFNASFDANGAGQNRQQSKAIFHHKAHWGYTADKIEQFLEKRFADLIQTNQDVHVYFITGIAGGTGSGSFIELSQMIRRAFQKVTNNNIQMEGFFYLPDVIDEFFNANQLPNLYANAYAALKEMDYYYAAAQRGYGTDYLEMDGVGNLPWEVSSRRPLFDSIRLVSGSNGAIIPESRNAQAIQTVSEAIINLIATSNVVGGGQDYRQTKSNQRAQRTNVLRECYVGGVGNHANQEANNVCAEDTFRYLSVGTASLSILQNPIKMNMIARTMRTLSGKVNGFTAQEGFSGFRNDPVLLAQADVEIDGLKLLTPDAVFNKLRELTTLTWSGTANTTLGALCNDQRNHTQFMVSTVDAIMARNPSGKGRVAYSDIYNLLIPELNAFFEEKAKETIANLNAFMKKFGPKALYFLYEGKGQGGRFPVDHSIKDKIRNYSLLHFEKKDLKRKYQDALTAGTDANRLLVFPHVKENARNQLSRIIREKAQEDLAERAGSHVEDAYREYYLDVLTNYFMQIGAFAQSLDALFDVYENLGKSYEDGINGQATQDANSTRQNMLNDGIDYAWADGIVQAQAALINFKSVKESVIDSFSADPKKWTEFDPKQPADSPRNEMDRIMIDQKVANLGNQLTLTNLFANRIQMDPNWNQWLDRLLVNTLLPKAEPLYRANNIGVGIRPKKYLIVPQALVNIGGNGQQIGAVLSNICGANNIDLSYSTLDDSITCYSSQFALPLYSLQDLPRWEEAYETMPHFMQHSNESGRGIYDPQTGLEWVNYPALCLKQNPRIPDEATGRISREGKFFINTIDPMFQELLELGLIEQVQKDDGHGAVLYSYQCYLMTKRGWDWGNPETFNYMQYASAPGVKVNGLVQGGKTLVEYLSQQNVGGTLGDPEVTVQIRLVDDQQEFTDDCTNVQVAENRAKRVLRRNVNLIRALKTTMKLYKEYAKRIEVMNEAARYETVGGDMLWLIASGAIEKIDGVWYLKDHGYAGEFIQIMDTDPISVSEDWRFQGANRFEYLALREKFVEIFGRDAKILQRIQQAKGYARADDVTDPLAKKSIRDQRKKEYTDKLKNVFVDEAADVDKLKQPSGFQARQTLTQKIGRDVMPLLNDYETGVKGFYQLLQ